MVIRNDTTKFITSFYPIIKFCSFCAFLQHRPSGKWMREFTSEWLCALTQEESSVKFGSF